MERDTRVFVYFHTPYENDTKDQADIFSPPAPPMAIDPGALAGLEGILRHIRRWSSLLVALGLTECR